MACQLILALDLPDPEAAVDFLDRVGTQLQWVKIGLELFSSGGPDVVRQVAAKGYKVFLDLKLHDIPNTVASAVRNLRTLPIEMLTLHVTGGKEMMTAAVQEASHLKLIGVTVLTSLDDSSEVHLGKLGMEAGMSGLVCSGLDLSELRSLFGPQTILVTPGIRPTGSAKDDQRRVVSPKEAVQMGASFIVMGRPLLTAPDPAQTVGEIQRELSTTYSRPMLEKVTYPQSIPVDYTNFSLGHAQCEGNIFLEKHRVDKPLRDFTEEDIHRVVTAFQENPGILMEIWLYDRTYRRRHLPLGTLGFRVEDATDWRRLCGTVLQFECTGHMYTTCYSDTFEAWWNAQLKMWTIPAVNGDILGVHMIPLMSFQLYLV